MVTYLVDTHVFAAIAQPIPHRAVQRAFERHASSIATASVVLHELAFGIERLPPSRRREHLERFLAEIVGVVPIFGYGAEEARWHAAERVRLSAQGRPPPYADGQIAAIAAVRDATLVTANTTDFAGFKGLRVVNWAKG